jgi:hypothetical protein
MPLPKIFLRDYVYSEDNVFTIHYCGKHLRFEGLAAGYAGSVMNQDVKY